MIPGIAGFVTGALDAGGFVGMEWRVTRTLSLFALLLLPLSAATWSNDFDAALKEAKASSKTVLIDFTGSDWCAWCIKLRKEVFDQPEFEAAAKEKFVLVELDYPKDKTRVTEAVAKQNEALLKRYPIKGYPTILLCDGDGKPFAATAYQEGGPAKYLPHLDELLAKRAARDKAFTEAGAKEGVEKAKLLIAALEGLKLDPPMVASNYAEIAEEIKKADPLQRRIRNREHGVELRLDLRLPLVIEGGDSQIGLGFEEVIEATLLHPGLLANGVNRHDPVAVLPD